MDNSLETPPGRRRRSAAVCRVLLLLIATAWTGGTAWSQTGPTLEAQPASADVPPWERQIETRIVLRNDDKTVLLGPTLVPFTNDLFHVTIQAPGASRVNPGESVVWIARVDNVDAARVPGSVQFEVRYQVAGKPGVQRLYAALKIQAAAAPADKSIEASVQGSFDAISEARAGLGHLLIANNLDVPVRIASVTVLPSDGRDFRTSADSKNQETTKIDPPQFDVPARSSARAAITLPTASQVASGKQPVVFDVQAEWDQGGHHYTRHLLVSQDVNVGVFFESEILKAVGVPSFLLLPGCLFLLTMQLLLMLGVFGLNRYSKVPDVPMTSPAFWIVAVTFSGVFAWAYTSLTGTDYLVRYGPRDLRNVWLWSIALGALVYAFVAAVTFWRRNQRVPNTNDSPVDTLLKMGRRGLGIDARRVTFKIGSIEFEAFLIEQLEDGQTMVWVAPRIIATWNGARAPREHKEMEDAINQRNSPLAIGGAIRQAQLNKNAEASWDTQGSVPGPYHLKVESITQPLPDDVIVRLA